MYNILQQSRLLLQFHITGRCNLKCKHCYRTEGNVEPLGFDDIVNIIEQYKELLQKYNQCYGIKRKGHINITGGEPFIRRDIKDILRYLHKNRRFFTFGILSNGSFIDEDMIKVLKESEVSFIQLSLDGTREIHDDLRAAGDYDRVLKTADFLQKNGIRAYISFTANKKNYGNLPEIAKECRKRKLSKLWSDCMVPIGTGEELSELEITSTDFPEYAKALKKAQGNFLTKKFHPKTVVSANRALQFLYCDGDIYSCSAGDSLVTVDEFGNIMPCRRMPIICGNVFESTMLKVFSEHETFKELRTKPIPKECAECVYASFCRGGAKCRSYAKYGSYFRADPACPLAKRDNIK